MAIPFLSNDDDTNRHDDGVGYVHQGTMEIGDSVVALRNVGSIRIIMGRRRRRILLIGLLLFFGGGGGVLFELSSGYGEFILGYGLVLLLGAIFVVGFFNHKPKNVLSIGTSDGRAHWIVSNDSEFLADILNFLRDKIDRQDPRMTGTFNITNQSFETGGGAVAVGDHGVASGRGGSAARSRARPNDAEETRYPRDPFDPEPAADRYPSEQRRERDRYDAPRRAADRYDLDPYDEDPRDDSRREPGRDADRDLDRDRAVRRRDRPRRDRY